MLNQKLMGAAGPAPNYIEDVFSTFLYTGNGSTQTINNGIDLAGKGGLVWIKERLSAFNFHHALFDTARGPNQQLRSQLADGQFNFANSLTGFNSNGFSLGADSAGGYVNSAGSYSYASWTFRKQPKFFDVVTWTGNGANRTIAHNLGSVPGCIIVKRTDTTGAWQVYHRSLANTQYMVLNTTAAVATGATRWNSTTPTSTGFRLGTDATVNASGGTYVAYLYAHDAGGFGESGEDNVVSCGSYTGNGSATGPVVTLGYEPQWLMVRNITGAGNWQMIDNMRGMPVGSADATLRANLTNAELSVDYVSPTATGFQVTSTSTEVNTNAATYIYIAIRRGPMKVPTTGTSVFAPLYRQGNGVQTALSVGFPPDLAWTGQVNSDSTCFRSVVDRLRGVRVSGEGTGLLTQSLQSQNNGYSSEYVSFNQNGMTVSTGPNQLGNGSSAYFFSYQFFKRAPSFMDVCCYTGTGANQTVAHNLGVVPELMIVKSRSPAGDWFVYSASLGNTKTIYLSISNPPVSASDWNNTSPTSSAFTVGTNISNSGVTYVAYLFASCPGVSKVGSYTGNGSSQTINCGFTGGARFILIRRIDNGVVGDWYVWDSARGIVAGNDPHLSLNNTAAQITTNDSVDPVASGFAVNQDAATNINVSSASYIYLAIA